MPGNMAGHSFVTIKTQHPEVTRVDTCTSVFSWQLWDIAY